METILEVEGPRFTGIRLVGRHESATFFAAAAPKRDAKEPTKPARGLRTDIRGRSQMLTIAKAQQRTERFLTGQMIEALQAVEYELPSFDTEPREVHLSDAARSRVQIRHARTASDATYLHT
jgi:hypothetical protein